MLVPHTDTHTWRYPVKYWFHESHLHINWNFPLVGQQIVDLFSMVKWRRKSCHVKLKANFFHRRPTFNDEEGGRRLKRTTKNKLSTEILMMRRSEMCKWCCQQRTASKETFSKLILLPFICFHALFTQHLMLVLSLSLSDSKCCDNKSREKTKME